MENMENKVCLDGSIFRDFKAYFDTVLKDTLTTMIKNGISEGTVTGKIKITLETDAESGDFVLNEPERAQTRMDDFALTGR